MNPPHHQVGDGRLGLIHRVRDHDTFASREPVGFDHNGTACPAEVSQRLLGAVEHLEIRGGDLPPAHKGFGEDFAGFDLRRSGRGPEHSQSPRGEHVGEACGERSLRTDDRQVDTEVGGNRRKGCGIGRCNRKTRRNGGDSWVSRRGVCLYPTALDEPPGQGVLPATGTHNKHLQQTRPRESS